MSHQTFTQSVETFVEASPWIGPEHAPALATLWALAAMLDDELSPAGAAQFGLTYRNLAKLAPTAPAEIDELERLLGGADE